MAKKYKVNVIKVLLKNGKTAKSGDIISGDKLSNEEESVKSGYVVEHKPKGSKTSDSKNNNSSKSSGSDSEK